MINLNSGLLKGAFKKLRRSRKFKNEKHEEVLKHIRLIHKHINKNLIGKAKKKLELN